jgi:FkbM family methyltransferase
VISYAQNAEDVVLARLFADRPNGRYVDIGAGDPVEASVTKHFYDLGWRGVNVEPIASLADRLRAERPEDITLAAAVGAKAGSVVLHELPTAWGWSTVDDQLAGRYRAQNGWEVRDVEVEQMTLANLLDEHPGEIDFLKIDVEGAERDVIEGADWARHRPRAIVVEATEPGSSVPAYHDWEPILLEAGYRCALFDGLNRFYAQAEDREALDRLSVPANVFDEFEQYGVVRLRADLRELRAGRAAEIGYARRMERELRELNRTQEQDASYLKELEASIAEQRRRLTTAARHAAALESRIRELEAQLRSYQSR